MSDDNRYMLKTKVSKELKDGIIPDPQKPNVPQVDIPTLPIEIKATGLVKTPDGVHVAIMLKDDDGRSHLTLLHPAAAERLTSRLSGLVKAAYWANKGGETLEPIIDLS